MNTQKKLSNIISDGDVRPASEIQLPATSRLAMYGEGCFETFRAYKGGFLHPEAHLRRLHKGMDYLGLEIPDALSTSGAFFDLLKTFLQTNKVMDQDVRLRLQVRADDETAGYRPGNRTTKFLLTGVVIDPSTPSRPVRLATSTYRRIPNNALPADVKWSNGINYILAAREATTNGADDALMLTRDDYVSETTIANIFWKSGDTIYTPSETCDLLPGITRDLLTEYLGAFGIPVKTGIYKPEELFRADAIWLCNSIREWYPVTRLDHHKTGFDETFWNTVTTHFEKRKNEELHYV